MVLNQQIKALKRFLESEEGPTAVEYAVLLALIIGALISAAQIMAASTRESFDTSANAINEAIGS